MIISLSAEEDTNILSFRYLRSQISNVQTFVVYYKFGDEGNLNTIILSKDDCMDKFLVKEEKFMVDGEEKWVYVFNYVFNPNMAGKLFIRVVPTNAVSILLHETEYII